MINAMTPVHGPMFFLLGSRLPLPCGVFIGSLNNTLDAGKLVLGLKDVELGTLKLGFSWRENGKNVGVMSEAVDE